MPPTFNSSGENPDRIYGQTRMDAMWNFRDAYDQARTLMHAQDEFCAKAQAGAWEDLDTQTFPDNLHWESLVDVLRGKVKVCIYLVCLF